MLPASGDGRTDREEVPWTRTRLTSKPRTTPRPARGHGYPRPARPPAAVAGGVRTAGRVRPPRVPPPGPLASRLRHRGLHQAPRPRHSVDRHPRRPAPADLAAGGGHLLADR